MPEKIAKVIWMVDDNERQLNTYVSAFQQAISSYADVSVEGMVAAPRKEDYLRVLNDPRTVCLIVDQRLKEFGIADHDGIELATYLRAINDKIPIYILTNFAQVTEEFAEGEWNVEDVISKGDVGDSARMRVIVERLLRRIDQAVEISGDREKRFRELLKKSLKESLSEEELEELEELEFLRASGVLADEIGLIEEMSEALDSLKELKAKFPSEKTDTET